MLQIWYKFVFKSSKIMYSKYVPCIYNVSRRFGILHVMTFQYIVCNLFVRMQKNAHIHLCSCLVKCVFFSTQIPSASSSRKIAADIGFQHFDLLPICHCSLIHNPPSSVAILLDAIPIVFTGKRGKKV